MPHVRIIAERTLYGEALRCLLQGLPGFTVTLGTLPSGDMVVLTHSPSPELIAGLAFFRKGGGKVIRLGWAGDAVEDAVVNEDAPLEEFLRVLDGLLGTAPRRHHRDELTEREWETVSLAAQGAQNENIAERMQIRTNTVRNHMARAYQKLGVRNRAQLVRAVRSWQLRRN